MYLGLIEDQSAVSPFCALWALHKNRAVHQLISSQVFTKKEHKAKVDLYQRLQAECVILYQEKKRRKPMLIILRLSSESNEPKPIEHWSQGQCLFTTQSHWNPWNCQLNRLFRGFQNWTQYHPTTYFYPKLTFKNSEDEFKKSCMSFGSCDKNLILVIFKKKTKVLTGY